MVEDELEAGGFWGEEELEDGGSWGEEELEDGVFWGEDELEDEGFGLSEAEMVLAATHAVPDA